MEIKKKHYTLIRHMSRLMAGRTYHVGKYFCLRVLPSSMRTSENFYNKHILECSAHSPQRVVYPEEGSTLEWTGIAKTEPVPFAIYADFESVLVPGSNDKLKNAIDTRIPTGFCCLIVSKYEKYINQPPKLYSGPNVMDHSYNHLIKAKERKNEILQNNEPMKPLTLQQELSHDNATSYMMCHKSFTPGNHKVRHHCHVTGEYIGPACINCNLQLKPRHVSSG
jgi:hypothetical protein